MDYQWFPWFGNAGLEIQDFRYGPLESRELYPHPGTQTIRAPGYIERLDYEGWLVLPVNGCRSPCFRLFYNYSPDTAGHFTFYGLHT
jgi:hypothetical protein